MRQSKTNGRGWAWSSSLWLWRIKEMFGWGSCPPSLCICFLSSCEGSELGFEPLGDLCFALFQYPCLCLLPAGLWRPGVDPDCLLPGTLAPGPGLGDVCVCVLLCGHHFPDDLVHNWYSWRWDFLDHTGCSLPLCGCPILPQCLSSGSPGHHLNVWWLYLQALPWKHRRSGVCLRGHSDLRGPCCVFLNQMEVFIGQQIGSWDPDAINWSAHLPH